MNEFDILDRQSQDAAAQDERACGTCDAALGGEIELGNLHPAYIDAFVAEIRRNLEQASPGTVLSLRWHLNLVGEDEF